MLLSHIRPVEMVRYTVFVAFIALYLGPHCLILFVFPVFFLLLFFFNNQQYQIPGGPLQDTLLKQQFPNAVTLLI